uniref:Sodium/potassium-transporting ATPase subunit beta n=1 Tax=Maylandia zebra TaxID=106582 RepID=A0A3P9B1A6_9CICH
MATLKEKRTCGQRCEDFGRFVWNSENGTFMGRTPEKWVYISLYYVAFYVIMTGLFSLAIWVLMYTISPYKPDYQDRLTSPASAFPLRVMVWPDTYGEEDVEISYNTSEKASCMEMANILHDFLKPYNDTKQLECNNYNCTKGKYFIQKTFSAPHHTKWACPFTQSMLGPCSGIEDPTFGYNSTMPCVVIKMNRIIDFLPSNNTVPSFLCCTWVRNQHSASSSFFLFLQPTYVNPLVAVRFSLVGEKEAKIQCRVVSEKISYENIHDPYEGKVVFYLKAVK